MQVVKRNGFKQSVDFNKITERLRKLCTEFEIKESDIDPIEVAKKVCDSIHDGIQTAQLDNLCAEIAITLATKHPEFGRLASLIETSNLHKSTLGDFQKITDLLTLDEILDDRYIDFVHDNIDVIKEAIDYSYDYSFDYFGMKTLQKAYLFKHNNKIIERPQDMWMRVALFIHLDDIEAALETYNALSSKLFTHATPTLYNAGTKWPQLSSCYLVELKDDSIHGIYETLGDCAQISKWAGGIGVHIHKLRATGSDIRKNKNVCSGIVPALRVFNATSRYVNQGGKRPGSIAIYLSVEHADIMKFLDLRKNVGDEEERCRDLFYGLWVSDLFMERVKNNAKWSLFCPHKAPGLADVYGEEYKELYLRYEQDGLYNEQVDAQKLWFRICNSQIETGNPYMLYKDHVNHKSNQKNLGVIKSSNLCVSPDTKILTDQGEIEIGQFENKSVNVWNGEQFSKVTIKKTSNHTQLMKVHLDTNRFIECTYYHKFYTKCSSDLSLATPACDLKIGDELQAFHLPDGTLVEPTVTNIELSTRFSSTYCFKESSRNMGVFNGILTGQCTEILEYTSPEEIAVCNLASISLPMFVENGTFNHTSLHKTVQMITRNLNKVIDVNFYPLKEAQLSNMRHRPIGIGVQGLADTYMMMKYPFDSAKASELNKEIFETIYHASLTASMELAFKHGPYVSFDKSPTSYGILQFDMWDSVSHSGRYDWDLLKEEIKKKGLRNSLLVAPMPTASTSQILGNNECIEPYTSNIYLRRTIAGEFVVINKHMIKDLIELGLWSESLKDEIVLHHGSIQNIFNIPQHIKDLYKTAWEIKQKVLIDQAADRGVYVCQSQSLNLFVSKPDLKTLSSMHFYTWNKGLKTGMYYLRTQPAASPIQFTINPTSCDSCSG